MKAVIYHADARIAKQYDENIYTKLISGLHRNLNSFNVPLIHLTLEGFPGLGDENYFYQGDPENITYNREKFFLNFLKESNNELLYLTEPDSRIVNMFPSMDESADLSLLFRHDDVHIPPAWRLAKKTAVPFFEELLSIFKSKGKSWWEGDSSSFTEMWKRIGEPQGEGIYKYNGMTIELRPYKLYCMRKSWLVQQFKGHHKNELIEREQNERL